MLTVTSATVGQNQIAGISAQGPERVVVDLAAGDDRDGVVEQVRQLPEHARLGLSAQAEEEHVVLGEDGVLNLWDDGLIVADDAGKERFAGLETADEVMAHFLFDGNHLIAAGFELTKCPGSVHVV